MEKKLILSHRKKFRQIDSFLVTSIVKTLLSRNIYQKRVRVNFRNFRNVHLCKHFVFYLISRKNSSNCISNFSMFDTPLIDISPSPQRLVIQRASSLKYLLTWKTSFCYIVYIIYLLLYFKMMSITRGPLQRYDIC